MDVARPDLKLHRADGFLARLGGLLARPPLGDDEALLLAPCSSVHTLFMRYAIDVVFVDRAGRVLKVVGGVSPWRAAWCFGAHAVLELREGQARRHGLRPGVAVARIDPKGQRP